MFLVNDTIACEFYLFAGGQCSRFVAGILVYDKLTCLVWRVLRLYPEHIISCLLQKLKNSALLPVDLEALTGSLKELIVSPQRVAFSVKK